VERVWNAGIKIGNVYYYKNLDKVKGPYYTERINVGKMGITVTVKFEHNELGTPECGIINMYC